MVLHPFMYLFLIYTPVISIKTVFFQQGLNRMVNRIKSFEIHMNDIYDDIFHAKP